MTLISTIVALGESKGLEHSAMTTFGGAVAIGVFVLLIAEKLRTSNIVLLMLAGYLVGPEVLGIIHPASLGDGLKTIVGLSVGIILFEGGLSLEPKGYKEASKEIRGILSIGMAATWIATTVLLRVVRPDFGWKLCLLFAALTLITGPSVIAPMMKRLHIKSKLHHILHWEGVLADPIGVFIALFCFKLAFLSDQADIMPALSEFGLRMLTGLSLGAVGGILLTVALRRKWIPEDSLNTFVLGCAVLIFSVSDLISHESGLLAVTIAGFSVGAQGLPQVRRLREYKAELMEMLIGMLFVLLAAKMELRAFLDLGVGGWVAVLVVTFFIRPATVFISTIGSGLNAKEKLYLGWIGPRGLVAASLASLFAISFMELGDPKWAAAASFMEIFTYATIASTVIFQGFTAGVMGRWLGVIEPRRKGWLIIGAHRLARRIATFLQSHEIPVVVIDTNPRHVKLAKREGLTAICANPLTVTSNAHPEIYGAGHLLAITEYDDLNHRVCARFKLDDKELTLYKWTGSDEDVDDQELNVGTSVWPMLQLSQLKAMDAEGLKAIEQVAGNWSTIRHAERALMCIRPDETTPFIPFEGKDEWPILMYQPFATGLDLNIKPEWTRFSNAKNMQELFGELLTALKGDYPELDAETIKEKLIAQENEFSSYVGFSVALPHYHLEDIGTSVVLIAKMIEPLKDLHSDEEIHYVFLVLSPSSQPKAHLNSLSEISRFIMEEQNRELLEDASDRTELQAIFFKE